MVLGDIEFFFRSIVQNIDLIVNLSSVFMKLE